MLIRDNKNLSFDTLYFLIKFTLFNEVVKKVVFSEFVFPFKTVLEISSNLKKEKKERKDYMRENYKKVKRLINRYGFPCRLKKARKVVK